MKKHLFLVLLTLITLTSFTSKDDHREFNFIGKWSGVDGKEKGSFLFEKNGYASIQMDGELKGGKEFDLNGRKGSLAYKFDQSTTPIKLDLILTDLDTGESKKKLFIVKIINDNKIIIAQGFDDKRPKTFTKTNSTTLTRE